jgi:hypothetical protein
MRLAVSTALFFVFALPLCASDRVLLPLFTNEIVPGDQGSQWQTSLAIFNPTSNEYKFESCGENEICEAGPGSADLFIMPGETQTTLPSDKYSMSSGARGYVAYFERVDSVSEGQPLPIQLRARDLSRNAQSAGTEIPVVRESAFRTAKTHLLNIPVDNRFRSTLRIYEMGLDHASFAVRVYNATSNVLVTETTATLATTRRGELRLEPGYFQTGNLVPSATSARTVRVEIEPLTPGSSFWAFISITNNATQEFTLITP